MGWRDDDVRRWRRVSGVGIGGATGIVDKDDAVHVIFLAFFVVGTRQEGRVVALQVQPAVQMVVVHQRNAGRTNAGGMRAGFVLMWRHHWKDRQWAC